MNWPYRVKRRKAKSAMMAQNDAAIARVSHALIASSPIIWTGQNIDGKIV